ncbi:hypothetical protein TNCT_281911 [Trichonephila clavata]|uniref:Uncharacterized protein n=1 Tax=Trichonephila clavata TaxID=2740835 RepID=A0A8X6GTW9_TRICU|nr:hypothetical protein TNCT_281911 [Trichonephila clavata]
MREILFSFIYVVGRKGLAKKRFPEAQATFSHRKCQLLEPNKKSIYGRNPNQAQVLALDHVILTISFPFRRTRGNLSPEPRSPPSDDARRKKPQLPTLTFRSKMECQSHNGFSGCCRWRASNIIVCSCDGFVLRLLD